MMSKIFNNNFDEVCFDEPCFNELCHVLTYVPNFEELLEILKSAALTLNIEFQETAFKKMPVFILGWLQNYWKTIYANWDKLNLPAPQLRPTFIQLKQTSPSYEKLAILFDDNELFEQEVYNSIEKIARMAHVNYPTTNVVDLMIWADHFWEKYLEKPYIELLKENRKNKKNYYPLDDISMTINNDGIKFWCKGYQKLSRCYGHELNQQELQHVCSVLSTYAQIDPPMHGALVYLIGWLDEKWAVLLPHLTNIFPQTP